MNTNTTNSLRPMHVTRLRAGAYLVNSRYEVTLISKRGMGALYDTGPVWVWRDPQTPGVFAQGFDTRAQALDSLSAHLGAQATIDRRCTGCGEVVGNPAAHRDCIACSCADADGLCPDHRRRK